MAGGWGGDDHADAGMAQHASGRRAMGAAERRRWSSHIRQELIGLAATELADPHNRGVVVLGPRGVGKTTLVRSVEARLAESTHFVRLFGPGTETAIPYGVWSIHLARLDGMGPTTPHAIIQGIAALVRADAAGRDVVLVLDDLPTVDTLSMGVLMHLVFSEAAKVMVLGRSIHDLPEDLAGLFKDGLLSKLSLQNLTGNEIRHLIVKALGGSVAAATVAALHESSGGNPLILHTLVHTEMHNGHFVQRDRTWVLNRALPAEPARALTELVHTRLAQESEQVRRGVEVMSLIQRAPLSMVMDLLGAETVTQLEKLNYLVISNKAGQFTSLAEPYIGETVRAMMGRAEKARLYEELRDVVSLDSTRLSRMELLVIATWILDAGMPLEAGIAVSAAKAAVSYLEPMLALRIADAVTDCSAFAVQAAQARSAAYSLLADYPQALAQLLGSRDLAKSTLTLPEYAGWVADLTSAMLWVDDEAAQIPAILADEMAALESSGQEPEQVEMACRRLRLALWEFHVHNGRFREMAPLLEAGYRDPADTDYSRYCGSLLVMAWAGTGRELEAVALAREIGQHPNGASPYLRQADLRMHGLVMALIWSGQWKQAAEILSGMLSTTRQCSEYHGGIIELGLGLAYASAGKAAEAVETLRVAMAQLEIRNMYHSSPVAYAALAYAFARLDDRGEAAKYLGLAEAFTSNVLWANRAVADFFILMARRQLGDAGAVVGLAEGARENIAAGRYTLASLSLFGAASSDREQDLLLLKETAAQQQGPMAELSLLLAQAFLDNDAGQALAAAAMAEKLGLHSVQRRCSAAALEIGQDTRNQPSGRKARARPDRRVGKTPKLPPAPDIPGAALTPRELEVARLAAQGLGNRAIADVMHVSARTIEGHLYQIYAKLGISSRHDLK